jgi:CRISPR system Cascade subunit CasD
MSTLLLRFAAPLQSWGVESKFNRRGTEREPTKSGVIGFLASALGRGRAENVDDLAALKFGVRIDQPGQLLVDYHLAITEAARAPGAGDTKKNAGTFQTWRHYLADAVFLVGLEGDKAFLENLDEAVHSPVFPLYLGRRSCPPAGKISLGISPKPLREALTSEIWLASEWYKKKIFKSKMNETSSKMNETSSLSLTLVCDAERPGALYRRDVPVSFDQTHRKYAFRSVDDIPNAVPISKEISKEVSTRHDAFAELEGED